MSPKTIWKIVGTLFLTGCVCLSSFPLLSLHPGLRNFLVLLGVQLFFLPILGVIVFGKVWGLWGDGQPRDGLANKKAYERDIAITKNAVLGFTVFGLLSICFLAFTPVAPFSWVTSIRIMGMGFLYAAAFFAAGALIGFLFGIPRSVSTAGKDDKSGADDQQQARYKPNTNLEEISDWLTKIIVGLGLINLKSIPTQLKTAAWFFANFCGRDYCEPVAMALIIYFSVCGFFLAYLMTRLYLTGAFTRADRAAAIAGTVDDPLPGQTIKHGPSPGLPPPKGGMKVTLDDSDSYNSVSGGDIVQIIDK